MGLPVRRPGWRRSPDQGPHPGGVVRPSGLWSQERL